MKIKGIYHMPGSKFLWYRWTQDGIRQAVSLKTDDLSEAIKKIEQIRTGTYIAQWAGKSQPPKTHLTKLVENYLSKAQDRGKKPMRPRTAKKKEAVLLKFLRDSGVALVEQISQPTVESWLAKLKKEGRSLDTLHTYARDLNTFVGFLVKNRYLRADLLATLRFQSGQRPGGKIGLSTTK
jgi:hypothetical protein